MLANSWFLQSLLFKYSLTVLAVTLYRILIISPWNPSIPEWKANVHEFRSIILQLRSGINIAPFFLRELRVRTLVFVDISQEIYVSSVLTVPFEGVVLFSCRRIEKVTEYYIDGNNGALMSWKHDCWGIKRGGIVFTLCMRELIERWKQIFVFWAVYYAWSLILNWFRWCRMAPYTKYSFKKGVLVWPLWIA